jgi:DNA-binding beta-propeller fold protein YncE
VLSALADLFVDAGRIKMVKRLVPLLALLLLAVPAGGARSGGINPTALVTAETENQVIAVSIPSGHVVRRLRVPADPENVDARTGVRTAVVVSTGGRAVTLIDTKRLRIIRVLHGFRKPHIPAITPNGRYAYVSDDARGKLVVIDLRHNREVSHVFVGFGAHHMGISPDGRRTWVALGEHAHRIVAIDTSRPTRPRVIGGVHLRHNGHDLAFTPNDARVWVTHSDNSRVDIYDARTRRRLKSFDGGAPPQHVAFMPTFPRRTALVTSGYSGTMQIRDARTGRLLRTLQNTYGSFNLGLDTRAGIVATSSLLRGDLTVFNILGRHVLGRWHLAPATRDVALF